MKTHFYKKDILEICDERHLTVAEIFEELQKRYPTAGKSSVYRNVEEMVDSGELNKVIGIGKKAYFEKNNGYHIHIIDKNTGKIMDIEKSENFKIPNLPKNFHIDSIDIKIFGNFE